METMEAPGFVGIEVQAFPGFRPNRATEYHSHCHKIKHLLKAKTVLWVFTQWISVFPPANPTRSEAV